MTSHKKLRAIDRRRYVPSTEGLEGRELMTGVNTLFGLQVTTNLNVPITLQQKELRIDHLPYYLEKIQPGRFLPKTEIAEIQSSLFTMIDAINKPRTDALNNFNHQLRSVIDKQSLSPSDIATLDHGVSAVLGSAHAPQSSIDGIASGLFTLTSQVDTASIQPVFLGTNDNTLVLQTALAIGRPMPPPQLPRIKKNQGVQANVNHIKTPLAHPTLVGTYHYHTVIQVITPQGVVVGQANCRKDNNFEVNITTALSVGTHEFRLQAEDDAGHLSRVSRAFLIKVVAKSQPKTTVGKATPQGPLAKKS